MASYRQILYHLTFHTKNSNKVLDSSANDELYKYIWGVLKNNNCKLYRINGVEDHIHIVCDLHPSIALADLMKDIKVSSSVWIKEQKIYPLFSHCDRCCKNLSNASNTVTCACALSKSNRT